MPTHPLPITAICITSWGVFLSSYHTRQIRLVSPSLVRVDSASMMSIPTKTYTVLDLEDIPCSFHLPQPRMKVITIAAHVKFLFTILRETMIIFFCKVLLHTLKTSSLNGPEEYRVNVVY